MCANLKKETKSERYFFAKQRQGPYTLIIDLIATPSLKSLLRSTILLNENYIRLKNSLWDQLIFANFATWRVNY